MKELTGFHKAYGTRWTAVPHSLILQQRFHSAKQCIDLFMRGMDVGKEDGDRDPDIDQALVVISLLLDLVNTNKDYQ